MQQVMPSPIQQPTTTTATSSSSSYAPGLESRMGYPQSGELTTTTTTTTTTNEPVEVIEVTPCPSEVMSSTLGTLPSSASLLSSVGLPFGVSICPLAIEAARVSEEEPNPAVPVVPYGATGIVRCRVCRAYVNPYVQWLEGGRRWRCNLCGLVNDVPGSYYSPVDPASGQRRDTPRRPELTHGCVEFVAPGEYMARSPMPPSFVFVLDATYTSISSGFFAASVAGIRSWLNNSDNNNNSSDNSAKYNPRTKVAFFAYDGAVYSFALRSGSKPSFRMLAVTDLSSSSSSSSSNGVMATPTVADELFVSLAECRASVDALLERLPEMFPSKAAAAPRHAGAAYGPALACAVNACKHAGGRIMTFLSSAPSVGAGGAAITPRDASKTVGNTKARAEREAALAQPLTDASGEYYKNMALDCSRCQITVDVITVASNPRHIELATVAQLAQFTGGEVLCRPPGRALSAAVACMLERPIAWEAVMRLRTSKNIAIANHYGHMFVRAIDLLALPAPDKGKGYCTALRLTDTLPVGSCAYLQNALLYTSSSGERRIRVSTLRLPVSAAAGDVFAAVDAAALVALLAKAAADKLSYAATLADARELVVRQLIHALAAYRRLTGPAPELAIPPAMAAVPLYVLGLLKHPALVVGADDVRADMRAAAIAALRSLPGEHMLVAMHPQLFNLSMIPEDPEQFPPPQTLSAASVDRSAIMLFSTGDVIVLFVGKDVTQETLLATFGTGSVLDAAAAVTAEPATSFPVVEGSPYNEAVRRVVGALAQARVDAGLAVPTISVTGDERILQVLLVDDHTRHFYSYQEFITQLQRNVEKELSN